MAKIKLSPLIQSMSGTIIRRKLPNGVSVACVVTKKGRIYVRTIRPRVKPLTESEINRRQKFGIVAAAAQLVALCRNATNAPASRSELWRALGNMYDDMRTAGKMITAQRLADRYCTAIV